MHFLDCTKGLAREVETMRRTGLYMHEKFVLYWNEFGAFFLLNNRCTLLFPGFKRSNYA